VLSIEPKAYRVFLFLLHNPQKLITKDELLHALWGDTSVTEGSLTRCIWLLRSLLGDDIRSDLSVARAKILINLAQVHSEIWMTQLR
jgi:DNA-binding winged helix-turn-helix (wHTH) protein